MTEINFESDIFYSQLAVFQYGLKNPFNDWNDIHINQGFAWREGAVSYGTLSDDTECKITIRVTDKKKVDAYVIKAIAVPSYIGNKGIEVGSVIKINFSFIVSFPHYDCRVIRPIDVILVKDHYISNSTSC